MGVFEMVVVLAVVCTAGSLLTDWMKAKHGYPITDEHGNVIRQETGTRAEAHEARIEALEKRLAVLERIATDRGAHTAEQIDALRDLERLAARDRQRAADNAAERAPERTAD
ncbi:hypothetical protein [Sphingomicrobium astaxanthinifaciens]|uniref:hypothetical protein n=1 Tax=Sphingomicrobium astaxanthinifaciens TaxID=1227949 RepID=UPI001FCA7EEA|nr:hypothetical protein [Sphingomicrobium astaxanthinifaciens]MCJ7422259.1 hypothetical protein [Sphingomicrobium astaxanthinifaciens]